MKKIVKLSLLCFFIILLANTIFAKWIYSEKADGWLYLDETTNTFIKSQWYLIDINDQLQRIYYFNENGFLSPNITLPDGKQTNSKGEYIENGQVVTVPKGTTATNQQPIIQQTTKTNEPAKIVNTTGKELKNDIAGSNVINTKNKDINDTSSNTSGRLLKNYIKEKQNVEIITEKNINGVKKNNVIFFKDNGSLISLNTKKYNKVNLVVERDKTSNDTASYEIHLIRNGLDEEYEQFEEEQYEMNVEFKYSINDEIDLVYYTNGQKTYGKNGIYITSGRMGKYSEEDDE